MNETNCFNSTDIGAADIYTLTMRESGEGRAQASTNAASDRMLERLAYWAYVPVALGGMWALL
jgi:hypothetical protein